MAAISSSVRAPTRVLSIDGGGVRGIIPLVILDNLESQLQKIDGPDARIADYFECTNTGALTAAMLTAPNENNRPLFTAKEIKEFYLDNFPKIFPRGNNIFSRAARNLKWRFGQQEKYDGKYLASLIKEKLGDTKLNQTLTDIVITTNPYTFSSYQVKNKDVLLSDICIGSLVIPSYLPPHSFERKSSNGKSKQFNLIGGAIDNPTVDAIMEIQEGKKGKFSPFVLSVGSCAPKYDFKKALDRLLYNYTRNNGSLSTLFSLGLAVALITDYDSLSYLLDSEGGERLRIQDDSLKGAMCSVDVATKKNLKNLVKAGEKLLKKRVSTLDSENRSYVPISEETNEEALIKLAATLSKEKQIRDSNTRQEKQIRDSNTRYKKMGWFNLGSYSFYS